jgi:hypothetical protein
MPDKSIVPIGIHEYCASRLNHSVRGSDCGGVSPWLPPAAFWAGLGTRRRRLHIRQGRRHPRRRRGQRTGPAQERSPCQVVLSLEDTAGSEYAPVIVTAIQLASADYLLPTTTMVEAVSSGKQEIATSGTLLRLPLRRGSDAQSCPGVVTNVKCKRRERT